MIYVEHYINYYLTRKYLDNSGHSSSIGHRLFSSFHLQINERKSVQDYHSAKASKIYKCILISSIRLSMISNLVSIMSNTAFLTSSLIAFKPLASTTLIQSDLAWTCGNIFSLLGNLDCVSKIFVALGFNFVLKNAYIEANISGNCMTA